MMVVVYEYQRSKDRIEIEEKKFNDKIADQEITKLVKDKSVYRIYIYKH